MAEDELTEESTSEISPESEEEQVPEPPPHGRIPAEGEAPEEAEEEPSPPPHGRVPEEQPPPPTLADLDIYDTLRFMIGVLNQAAWIHLGLVVAPGAKEAVTNLAQARVAIDSLEALAQQLQPASEPEERREIEILLANLRVNFVKQTE
jgi:hypothetical protein